MSEFDTEYFIKGLYRCGVDAPNYSSFLVKTADHIEQQEKEISRLRRAEEMLRELHRRGKWERVGIPDGITENSSYFLTQRAFKDAALWQDVAELLAQPPEGV